MIPERGLQSWFRPAKPETRNRLLKLVFELRNPKPETDSEDLTSPQDRSKPETRNRLWRLTFPRTDRNPKPETDSEDLTSPGPIETRNPKPTAKVGFKRRNPKPTAKVGFNRRNPKPETDSEDLTSPGPIETRNPKPTAKVGFNRRNPKPETDSNPTFGWLSGSELPWSSVRERPSTLRSKYNIWPKQWFPARAESTQSTCLALRCLCF